MATSLMKISSINLLNQFLHDCVNDLIDYKQVKFDNYSSDIEWTIEDYVGATNFIQNLYRESVLNASSDIDSKIQNVTPNIQQCIKDCFEIRKEQIYQAVVRENLSKNGLPVVENIDWKLKWIMGSSKLASLREPLLQVDLHCFKKENESNRKTINFEMNLDQVNKLIENLEKVSKDLSERTE